ncbi:hypothetical protein ACIBG4_30940 [Nonomuraea sp. NPDC050383]|uniref:hypothetical protein n=1 Tax=Nonomuraea sp. NPDC050383 TaxID=3364362 RepID=UPI003790E400
MFDEIVAHYDDLIAEIGDTIAYTVTIPDSGILTLEEAMHRMGFDPAALQAPGQLHSVGSLSLYQVGAGIATLDWINPAEERRQVTDRLAGVGHRHWQVSYDMACNTVMYVRYGADEGWVEHPEPARLPFTHWTEYLGPLIGYAGFLASGYDSEEAEAEVDMTAACLTVVELESGVRLDRELMDGPRTVLPLPEPDFAQF